MTFALRSAALAADVVQGGDPDDYRAMVEAEAADYQQLRGEIYGWETRLVGNSFWDERALTHC